LFCFSIFIHRGTQKNNFLNATNAVSISGPKNG
jgi:hypothetical protein